MANVLIINEKPSVSMEFSRALGVKQTEKHDGYIEGYSDFFGCTIWITWCIGHLVTLSYPEVYDEKYKKWNIDDLPFLPKEYLYEIIPDVKKQFNVVKKLLNTVGTSDNDRKELSTLSDEKKFLVPVTVIYNAGDSGREGEYIQRLVYMKAGWNKNAAMKRIWIDSQTDEEILRGIREAKDASYYDALASSAYARGIEDYVMGINFSRALSCKFGYEFNQKIKSEKYKPISVGRVMTCVLGMIVEREREIRDFKPTPFYGIEADSGFISMWKAVEGSKLKDHPSLYNDTGFKTKTAAENLIEVFNRKKALRVESVIKKQEKKKAPLLYNLAELQNDCSKKFKISPDKTLEIAQSLYEAKMTTYPRTDARVLSTAVAKEIHENIGGLTSYSHGGAFAKEIIQKGMYKGIEKTAYTDDSKITDHYAIIPTGIIQELDGLEKQVYELIVDRFLSIFYPPAVYEKVEVVLIHPSKEKFFASEKILKEYGYLEITGVDGNKQQTLSGIKEGSVLNAEFSIKEGSTQPPKRYNSGSMILAMENAGNLIEDEELRAQIKGSGIGTSATRAEVLKKLVKIGYICLNQKTQIITPHADGEAVYDIVKVNIKDMLSPKMTASWEKGLSQIEAGTITQKEYLDKLNSYVRKHVEDIKAKDAKQAEIKPVQILGTCPVCGGNFETKPWGAACSNYKDDCFMAISGDVLRVLCENNGEQLNKLLTEEETDVLSGFISKKGNSFKAAIKINREEKKVDMVFSDRPEYEVEESSFSCPRCKKMLHKAGPKLYCDCGKFTFWTEIGSKEHKKKLDDSQIQMLFDGLTIEVSGLISGKGTTYSCNVQMKKDGKMEMIFPNGKTADKKSSKKKN